MTEMRDLRPSDARRLRGAGRAGWVVAVAVAFAAAFGLGPTLLDGGPLRERRAHAELAQVRYAVLVGSNLGNDPARVLKYAEDDVVRLEDLLRRTGDFDDVLLLRSEGAAAVQEALTRLQTRLQADHAAGRPTLVFFYYSGHGDHEALELGSSRLPLRYLRESLEALQADVKIAFVDACHSGVMTGVKGGRRAPGYEVRLADPGSVRGMAIVTSSTGSEFSQESDELGASFFSHSVMTGLQGAADVSGDGRVTLAELYQYAFRRTLSTTAASLVGGQHPTYDYRMAGTGEVILTRVRTDDARLVFPRAATGTFTVMARDRVVAEVAAAGDGDQYLALPAGDYRVLRRLLGGVSQTALRLPPSATVRVDPAVMVAVRTLGANAKKGGAAPGGRGDATAEAMASASYDGSDFDGDGDGAAARARNQILGGYFLQSSPLAGAAGIGGAVLGYRRLLGEGRFELGVRGSYGRWSADDQGYRSSLWRAAAAVDGGARIAAWRGVRFVGGATVGVPFTRQHDALGEDVTSLGLRYGARTALVWAPAGPLLVGLDLEAGAESLRLHGALAHRPFAGAALSLGFGLD